MQENYSACLGVVVGLLGVGGWGLGVTFGMGWGPRALLRCGCLKRECKKCCTAETDKGRCIVPGKLFLQKQHCKSYKDGKRHHFLNYLQLETSELAISNLWLAPLSSIRTVQSPKKQ